MPSAHIIAANIGGLHALALQSSNLNRCRVDQSDSCAQQLVGMNVSDTTYSSIAEFGEAYEAERKAHIGAMRRIWLKPDIDRGHRIVERMAFWGEIPLVGKIVTARFAESLDRISDKLEAQDG